MQGRTPATGRDVVRPWLLLRIEGVAIALAGIALYGRLDVTWWLFGALILAPDLSMMGYLLGNRIGALSYNLFHTSASPAVLALIGISLDENALLAVALVWTVHIGADRTIGYGLKYEAGFKNTHLQRV
jgi:hypothetical protein